jgi:isocitrate dehydrogenase kinase/phosphatase
MFPHRLTDRRAFDIAQALIAGFDRHYRLFRETSAGAQGRFERPTGAASRTRRRAHRLLRPARQRGRGPAAQRVQHRAARMDTWQQAKLHYIGLLVDHHQPELAETFFNSVTAKLLHRSYFNNDFIFVRPAVSTEYIEDDEPGSKPTYRAYYPTKADLHETWRASSQLPAAVEFEDLERDVEHVVQADERRAGGLPAARQLPDPGAVQPVLPQQGRVPGRQDHQRLHRDAGGLPILHTRAASWSSTPRCSARTSC